MTPRDTRTLRALEIPPGPAVLSVLDELAAACDPVDAPTGDALLPVPADDPVRTRILVDALHPGEPIDGRTALVVSTSGSTGTPKGAMLSPEALAASADATHAWLGGPGRWLLALPAHHVAGLQVLLRSVRAGHTPTVLDVSRGFDPAALPAAVDAAREGAPRVYTSLVPGQLDKVLTEGGADDVAALASLDAVLLGGAAAAPELLARAADSGIRVVRTYGMSETAGGCVYDGLPFPGVRVETDDERRVWLAGPTLALGYRGLPEHPAFARDGWFRTDDAGELDPGSGRLRILGRLDEAMSVGGLTVLPQVVEDALRSHPAVVDVVVAGVPDRRLGERPGAGVVLRPGAPSDDELRAYVTGLLGDHSAPRTVLRLDALPLLPGGKVDRRRVAALLADTPDGTMDG